MSRFDAIHHAREKRVYRAVTLDGNEIKMKLSSYNDHAASTKLIVSSFVSLNPSSPRNERERKREREWNRNDLKAKNRVTFVLNRWLDSFFQQRNIPFRFIFYIKNLHKKIRTLSTLEKWRRRRGREREVIN